MPSAWAPMFCAYSATSLTKKFGWLNITKSCSRAGLLVGQQLFARHIKQLDRHAAGIANAVELRVGVAVGQPHHRLPGFARFGEHTLAQCRVKVGQHADFGLHATVGLGVGIAQVARAFAVLVNDAHGGLDDALGHRRFTGRDLFIRRHRPAVLPGVPGGGGQPAEQAQADQPQQGLAEKRSDAQPQAGEQGRLVVSRSDHHGNCCSSGPPSTLRYSSSAQRSCGSRPRPMTPLPRSPARNSWPLLWLPVILVSNRKAFLNAAGLKAQMARVVIEGAFIEGGAALVLGREQLVDRRHRAVMQERRGGPHAGQWPGLVGAQLAHANRQAVAIQARALGRGDTGGAVGVVFDEGGDVGQALGHGHFFQVQGLGWRRVQFDIELGQLRRVPLQGAEVIALVGDIAGGAGVGADVVHRQHFQVSAPGGHLPG